LKKLEEQEGGSPSVHHHAGETDNTELRGMTKWGVELGVGDVVWIRNRWSEVEQVKILL
jgi:hypothetical protein